MAAVNKDIENTFANLCNLVYTNRLKEALNQLEILLEGLFNSDFTLQYEDINQTYRMLLEYNFKGIPDPQRNIIFSKLKVSLLELVDRIRQQALTQKGLHIYQLKARIESEKESTKEEATRKIDSYSFELEFSKLLNYSDLASQDSQKDTLPSISPKLFQQMWLTDKYTETDLLLIKAIRESENLPWHEKCLAVSAITLSMINCFDKEKFEVLCDFYMDRQPQVWQRAFTGLVIAAFIYNKRIELYPIIQSKFIQCFSDSRFGVDLNNFLLQILKSFETEYITKKFREEILPDVQKFESKIRQKLDIDNLINSDIFEDKNPDWGQLFEDNPDLLNKVGKMSEMQMEGLDLFMGAFSMLKNFDFFREISNWFRPFYKENENAQNAISDQIKAKQSFLLGLEDSFYICNSDKYSFCFNINQLPGEQGNNIMNLFNMEAENMRELTREDGILNKPGKDSYVFTQYIQDLYRFFKLHPFRADFRDIFTQHWDIESNWLITNIADNTVILRNMAEFYFGKQHFGEALGLFLALAQKPETDQAVLEKLAYCYQMIGDYKSAVEYYKKAELFDANRLWSLKKIIFCYRKLGNIDLALKWGLEADSLEPDDVYIQTMLGNCYLDLEQYEVALNHYFKVEILSPENKKILRPIAWCCFVSGKLDLAHNYIQTIMLDHCTANDLVNAGHIEFCLGNKPKAINYYLSSIATENYSFKQFIETFDFDKHFLVANGIDPSQIQFIIDFIRYKG
ncbi:MAG: tetratricopeptide repeat protein [Bacteroidales bacterium]